VASIPDKDFPSQISAFLASRRSTREFLPTPVPQEIIDQILTDSLTAPSWSNTRPFKVAIATGEVRDRISNEFLSRWAVLSQIMRKGVRNKLRLIYFYIHKSLHVYAASDAGLMMQNLMLSAHAHGLGTCAQGAVNIWDDVIRKEFDISKDYRLLCGMAIGYPADTPVNKFQANRIGLDELIIKPKKSR